MTARRINPFARLENPFEPAPALNCRHKRCGCHVPIDHAFQQYERFRKMLSFLGDFQEKGLFVVVSGPSGTGKTSLINRCASLTKRTLAGRGMPTEILDLTGAGGGSRVLIDDRTRKVGNELISKLRSNQHLLDGGLPAELMPVDGYPDLDEVTRRVAEHLRPNAVVIATTPAAEHDQVEQVEKYLVGAQQRFLIFAESTALKLPQKITHSWKTAGGVYRLYLETGFLKPGDGMTFGRARTGNPGKSGTFPDLKLEDLERFTGGGNMPISFLQTILYKIYDSYVTDPSLCGNIVTVTDLERAIEAVSRDEGEVGRSS